MIKKIFIASMVTISCFILIANFLNKSKSNRFNKVLSIKTIYNIVDDGVETNSFCIPIYYTDNNRYIEKKLINSIAIINEFETQIFSVDLISINNIGSSYSGETKYNTYMYKLEFTTIGNSFSISEAYLKIVSEGKEIKLMIGDFNIFYEPTVGDPKDITINTLDGIIGEPPYQTINGIMLNIENKVKDNVTIKKIEIDRNIASIDKHFIVDTLSISDIHDLDAEYTPLYLFLSSQDLNIDIVKYAEINIVITIKYAEYYQMFSTPLIIYYEIDSIEKKYVFDNFCFFSNNYQIPSIKELLNEYDIN